MEGTMFQEDIITQIKENNRLLNDLLVKISDKIPMPRDSRPDATWLTGAESARYLGYNYTYFMNIIRHKYQLEQRRHDRYVYYRKDQLDALKQRNISE